MSEKDNIHLGVKQCCNKEGLSLASLQESTEAIFSKLFVKTVLLLTCKLLNIEYNNEYSYENIIKA